MNIISHTIREYIAYAYIYIKYIYKPIVAIPAPNNINKIPNARARHACHKHFDVIFPRTI